MKRIVLFLFCVLNIFSCLFCMEEFQGYQHCAYAAVPQPQVAQRELKKSKDYQPNELYDRAHHIIYGEKPPIGPGDRPRIAIVITGDEKIVVEDRIKNEIYTQIRKKFPYDDFAVMKGNDINTKLLTYEEDQYFNQRGSATTYSNSVRTKIDKLDVDGMSVPMQPRGIADMRCEDYVRAGKECKYDYLFILSFSNGEAKREGHDFLVFHSVTNHQNVWLRIRFVDVNNGDYLYRNNIVVQGESHNDSINGRIMQRAVGRAMNEALNDIDIIS